ncbi:tetratricopeptide repeat-containing sensor histidine kinase [Arundinibacter roseus]|uniref:histidine kinase n=1 Tax=Arundinibacter roseus TaxID=2070510 RepID=A0A4R4KPN0_9BACT|nr:tetratricopeptide repeat protein [Arundinibacter roseus]TDB68832.1 tetratricopeptide repeat protein [Arundinibacter roseus]
MLCFLVHAAVFGQNMALDTLVTKRKLLLQQVASPETDSLLLATTSLLTERLFNQNDRRADAYLDSLLQLSETYKNQWGEGLYWRATGKKYDVRGDYTKAFQAYTQAIAHFEKLPIDPYDLTYTYILAGFVLNNNGLPERCILYLQKALPLARQSSNTNNLCWILDFFGDYNYYDSFGIRNYPKALDYYLQVEKLLPRSTSPNLKADNPHGLANCYQKLGNEKLAAEYRNKALRIAKEANNRVVIFAIYADLADIHEAKGDFSKAIEYRNMSLDFAGQSGWNEMQSRAEGNLYLTYKKSGDYKNALLFLEKHKAREDSLQRYKLQQKYMELRESYDAELRENKIKNLENQSLLQTRNFLIIMLLLGLGAVGYIIWTNRRLRSSNNELLTKNREIEEALARGQSMERKRMASELHDNLNTKIAAIRWRLEALDRSDWLATDQKILNDVLGMVQDVYGDIRLISHNLLPEALETKGLKVAIQQLVGTLNGNDKTSFSFVFDGIETRLNPAVEYQLYTITLELVNNILKHAQASHAWISLTFQSNRVVLSVSDDGVGFESQHTTKEGVGLRNIQNRVDELHGTWTLESAPQQLTRVSIEIPMNETLVTASYTG